MPNSASNYGARYDLTAKIISALACVLILAAAVAVHNLIAGSLGLFILFLLYAYSPRGYRVAEGSIAVRRLIGDLHIPVSSIRESRRATPEDFRGALRLWASGGLFGYYGIFQSARLGKSTWYITNRKDAIVLMAGSKTILVSPDDPDRFLRTIANSEN